MPEVRSSPGCEHPTRIAFGAICLLLLLASLSACGGGGGGGTGGGGSPTSSSSSGSSGSGTSGTMPSVSASATHFSPTVSPSDAGPNYQVQLSINDPAGMQIYYGYTYDRIAIQGVNIRFPNPTGNTTQTAVLSFGLWPPAFLGSGTYNAQIQVQFCLDQQCQTPITGAPVVISIVYTVTGNVVSNVTFQVTPTASIYVEAPDTAATATATISVYTDQLPPYTTYLIGQSKRNGVVANGTWQVNEQGGGATGTLIVNLQSPKVIGSGVYSDVITLSICYDPACTKQAMGSPWVLPVDYIVTATAGVDYQVQMLKATASDIAWSATQGKLYAVTTSFSSLSPSSLLEIDPTSATVTRSVSLGGSPTVLSVSDDGLYAYVGFSDQSLVKRIALTSMTVDLSIALPNDPIYGPTYAGYLLAMPGASRSMAVSLYTLAQGVTDWDSRGTFLYDDATARPNTFLAPDTSTRVMSLSWGADSSTLYAYDGNQWRLFTATTSSSGLSLSNTATVRLPSVDLDYLNGLLYSGDGSVIDPSTGAVVAQFLDHNSVLGGPIGAVDATVGRAYFFYQEELTPAPLWTFATYDLQKQTVIAKTRVSGCSLGVGGVNGEVGRLVRWGSDGLAVNCQEGLEIISGVFVSP